MTDPMQVVSRIFRVNPSDPLPIVTGWRYGDRKLLAKACQELGYKTGAEIGVRRGSYTECFCQAGLEMWAIDPWLPMRNWGVERQAQAERDCRERLAPYNAHIVKKLSYEALEDVPGGLDFLHIDGNHDFDAVMLDLIQWCPKVRSGGMVALHDYHLSGVKHAIDAYTIAHRIEPWFVLKSVQPSAFWIVP